MGDKGVHWGFPAARRPFWLGHVAALLGLCLALPAFGATLKNVELTNAGGRITVSADFDDGIDGASSFALNAPMRVVIDLGGVTTGAVSRSEASGMAKLRAGQFSKDVARLVIEIDRPMLVQSAAVAADGKSFTLILRPAAAPEFDRFARAARVRYSRPAGAALAQAAPQAAKPVPPPAAAAPKAAARVEIPVPAPQRSVVDTLPPRRVAATVRANRPLVVIDPGHGGHDVGALSVWANRREKDATLMIAQAIRKELQASGRVQVVLTRENDRFLALGERVEVARRRKADLFISIHADSAGNPEARGATVYTLSEVASDREAARLAAKENKSDVINGIDLGREASDVSSILIDLAQRDTMNVSSSFAALLQRELAPYVLFKTQFHRFAGFRVLKAADTPSVLIETGYLSNVDDSKFLFSDQGPEAIARGVTKAVEAHFARRFARQ